MSTDRIIVHSAIAPTFIAALKAALSKNPEDPTSQPTLVSSASKTRVQKMIATAIDSGAQIIQGSVDTDTSIDASSATSVRMGPVIFGNVKQDSAIWQDESFASLAAVMVVDSDDEAVRVANEGGYGLSAAIFTEDLRKGFKLAKMIESG